MGTSPEKPRNILKLILTKFKWFWWVFHKIIAAVILCHRDANNIFWKLIKHRRGRKCIELSNNSPGYSLSTNSTSQILWFAPDLQRLCFGKDLNWSWPSTGGKSSSTHLRHRAGKKLQGHIAWSWWSLVANFVWAGQWWTIWSWMNLSIWDNLGVSVEIWDLGRTLI